MAERIESVTPSQHRYPWDEWTDGNAYRAVMGEDFNCSTDSFRQAIYQCAHRLKLSAKVSVHGETVEFQFSPREAG